MSQQKLHRAQVACASLDERDLGSTHGLHRVLQWVQADAPDLFADRNNIRLQINLSNQLIGPGEEHFSAQVSTGRRRPGIVEKWKR